MRSPHLDAMARQPPPCPCGAPAARAEIVKPRCHVCRAIATDHPDWTDEQVTAAGARKWLELALHAIRRLAQARPGDPISDVVFVDRLVWVAKDGYERLTIRSGAAEVLEALPAVHPDLAIAERAESGGVLALKLVASKGRAAA